jgi:hypothetical protein
VERLVDHSAVSHAPRCRGMAGPGGDQDDRLLGRDAHRGVDRTADSGRRTHRSPQRGGSGAVGIHRRPTRRHSREAGRTAGGAVGRPGRPDRMGEGRGRRDPRTLPHPARPSRHPTRAGRHREPAADPRRVGPRTAGRQISPLHRPPGRIRAGGVTRNGRRRPGAQLVRAVRDGGPRSQRRRNAGDRRSGRRITGDHRRRRDRPACPAAITGRPRRCGGPNSPRPGIRSRARAGRAARYQQPVRLAGDRTCHREGLRRGPGPPPPRPRPAPDR